MKIFYSILSALTALLLSRLPIVYSLPSENIVLYQVQTGGNGSGTASQELILLYNNSETDIEITNWCVKYSSSTNNPNEETATTKQLACVEPPDAHTALWLPSGGIVSFSTDEFVAENVGFEPDFVFNAGLASSGGHVWVESEDEEIIDLLGWGVALSPEGVAADVHNDGDVLSRDLLAEDVDTDINLADFSSHSVLETITADVFEVDIPIDLCPNIAELQLEIPEGYLIDEYGDCMLDFCPNIEDLQIVAPDGFHKPAGDEECVLIPLEDSTLLITELLPNAPSYDTGLEFIELYNPNNFEIDLVGYKLQLGLSFTKEYVFSTGTIKPGEYLIFSDTETGIVLPNTASSSVRIIAPAGNMVDESGVYSNASDDVSWAIVSDIWIYTNQITPGSDNKPYLEPVVDEVLGVTRVLAPCSAGKYRNPATNRCKNIKSAVSQLVPCKAGQERNPATNRCRSVNSSSSSFVPCKENQERNPDTNRCRNVSTLGDVSELSEVTDIKVESTEGQINWPIILLSISSTIAYMIYEWRFELRNKLLLHKTQKQT